MTSYPEATPVSQALRDASARLRESVGTSVVTEIVHTSEGLIVVRAEIQQADGVRVSAHAGAAAVERAEDAAIARAIALLAGDVAAPVELHPTTDAPAPHVAAPEMPAVPAAAEPVSARPPAPVAPPRPAAPVADASEPVLEDYSWTAFWKWARQHGLKDKPAVEAAIGHPIGNMSPAEVRAALAETVPS